LEMQSSNRAAPRRTGLVILHEDAGDASFGIGQLIIGFHEIAARIGKLPWPAKDNALKITLLDLQIHAKTPLSGARTARRSL
jgi:hypothetical protein